MFYHQLKITFRSLWRSRLFTILHITGLAIGLSAAWVMWQYVDFEYSHNRQIPNGGNIYRVVSSFTGIDNSQSSNAGCPEPLWRAAEEVAGIEKSVPVQSTFAVMVLPEGVKRGFKEVSEIAKTTPEYFGIVPYKWLAGSAATALSQPNEVVLARSRAEKYFPRHSPAEVLGKTVQYDFWSDTTVAEVVGVVEDLDFPTSFIGKEMLTVGEPDENRWGGVSSSNQLWVVLREGADRATVEESINKISDTKGGAALRQWKMSRTHELQPLAEVHFATRFGSNIRAADAGLLKVLSAVALFLLLLACINYINLSTARMPARSREIGIRKTLGGRNKGIIGSFLLETVFICLVATWLAGMVTQFAFVFFKNELPGDILKYADWRKTAVFLTLLVTAVSLFAGLYPGWLATRFQAVSLLRGQFSGQFGGGGNRGEGVRRGLIVFQFFIAQVFIIGALVVGSQLSFMRHSDLGFDKQAVLTMEQPISAWNDPALKNNLSVLASAFRQMPEIQQVALGDALLSNNSSSNNFTYNDESGNKHDVEVFRKNADGHLMDLYRLSMLAGRSLASTDSSNLFVINEAAVRAFGFEGAQAAVGQVILEYAGKDKPLQQRQIIGVVSDFHAMGFSEIIRPTVMVHDTEYLSTLNVRLASTNPADWQPALKKMEAEWQKAYPDEPFAAKFYDETLADIYRSDLTLARFINLATVIAILISCLGLFGLATFMVWRRTKEIGIRKVLGASLASVVGLLSREFIVLVLSGFLFAAPLAFYFLKKWLDNYAYRIEMSWWMFALAGILAVVVAFLTVGFQSVKAALANPVESLRSE